MKALLVSLLMLVGCTSMSQVRQTLGEVKTVDFVDLNKYLGQWYEVASIPQFFQKACVANTTAVYSIDKEDGLIVVMNSCGTEDGSRKIAEGRAKVEDTKTNSKLKVTFVKLFDWIFSFGGNYWVLDVDSGYNVALVGDPTRDYAWILSRTPSMTAAQWIDAEKTYKAQGYDTCKILTSVQAGGLLKRTPLCEFVNKEL